MGQPAARVTDPNSPVRFLLPESPLLNYPNQITLKDFAGWVQERGLYFWGEWDPRYKAVLGLKDFGEPEVKFGGSTMAPILALALPPRQYKELILTGRFIDAKRAEALGLINEVVSADSLNARTRGDVWRSTSRTRASGSRSSPTPRSATGG